MAEGLFNEMAYNRNLEALATSAGLHAVPGNPISRGAYGALLQEQINFSRHSTKVVDEQWLAWADRVLAMTEAMATQLKLEYPEYSHKVGQLGERDIADPFGGTLSDYVASREEIKEQVEKLIQELEENQ